MSQKPETRFKIRVQARLNKIAKIYHRKIQSKSLRGIPDLLICFRGWFIAWELKTDQGSTDALQDYDLAKVRQAGGFAMVVSPSNLEESIAFLLSLPHNMP